jgi:hypothetical protein
MALGVWRGKTLTLRSLAAFEGTAHPYKQNLVQFGGKRSITEIPEVKAKISPDTKS